MLKNMEPSVTICIPTYNRADYFLKQALNCALDQTYENIEIIVSNNCSSDDTDLVVNNYNDSRIRYYRQPKNIGANNNFNFCLKQAKGDYFLLLLDDDLIDPDFVETCMKLIDKKLQIGIIRTGSRTIDRDGNLLNESPNYDRGISIEDLIVKWFEWKTAFYLCCTIFNTDKLKKRGGFYSKHNLFQDVIAELELAARFGRIDIESIKSSYRQHPLSMSSTSKLSYWCEDSLFALESICNFVEKDSNLIRKKGLKYFSKFNYNLTKNISSLNRLVAYMIIFKYFKFSFARQLFSVLISRSPVYQPIKNIKNRYTEELTS